MPDTNIDRKLNEAAVLTGKGNVMLGVNLVCSANAAGRKGSR